METFLWFLNEKLYRLTPSYRWNTYKWAWVAFAELCIDHQHLTLPPRSFLREFACEYHDCEIVSRHV